MKLLRAIFALAVQHPEVLSAHVAGYSQLVREESALLTRRWIIRVLLTALATALLIVTLVALSFSLTLGLTGLAVWSWSLWAAPLVAALFTLIGLAAIWKHVSAPYRGLLGEQLQADLALARAYMEKSGD